MIGASKDCVEVEGEEQGTFFQSLQLRNSEDGELWTLINVYGPVQDERINSLFARSPGQEPSFLY